MKKRIITGIILSTMVLTLFAGCSKSETDGGSSKKTIVLKLSHHVTEGDSNDILFNEFADLVSEKTNGEVEIDIYANGQLYGQKDGLEALTLGTLDLAMSDTSLWSNYDVSTGLLDMPYVFKSREHAIKVSSSDIVDPIKQKLIDSAGIRPIMIQCLDFRNTFLKDMEVSTYEDFKNLKIRVPEAPTIIKTYQNVGANPVVIPSGEAYTSVQTGVADGLEGHAEYMVLQKFYEVAKNYVQTQHVMTFTSLNMSEDVYTSLSDSHKTALNEAAREALEYFYEYTEELFAQKFDELEANGVTITDIDRTPFQDAVKPYVAEFVEEYGLQDLYAEIQKAGE